MKKYGMFRSLAAIALLACAAFTTFCYQAVAAPVMTAFLAVKRCLTGWALSALALAAGKSGLDLNPVSLLVKAKSFYLRLAKRQRPTVTTGWRMCPST